MARRADFIKCNPSPTLRSPQPSPHIVKVTGILCELVLSDNPRCQRFRLWCRAYDPVRGVHDAWGAATCVQLLLRLDATLIPRNRLIHLQLVQRDQLTTKPVVESYVVEMTHALLWAPVN